MTPNLPIPTPLETSGGKRDNNKRAGRHRVERGRRMKIVALMVLAAALLAATMVRSESALLQNASTKWKYPEARQSDVVEAYHGTRVHDPYRWMEDPEAPETAAWVEAQNELTRSEEHAAQRPPR